MSILAIGALALVGCDDDVKPTKGAPSASVAGSTPTAPASAAQTQPAKLKGMPDVTVDDDGPYIAGTRINLGDPNVNGQEKLDKVVKELPIDGKPVTLIVSKKAKVSYVAATVAALGEAGAPKVTIKTDGRDDLPKEITVTPEAKLGSPPACSVATMILKDLSTAIWTVKGGAAAKKQRKGLAGPDLSHTGEQLTKDIAGCDSPMAFFSGEDAVPWESTFNLAGTVLKADEKKKLDTLVLVKETPVAGRAVALAKH